MKIAFFELEEWEKDYIKQNLKKQHAIFVNDKLTVETAAKAKECDAVAVFIYSKVDKAVLGKLPRLKFVATMSTGYDHIDLEDAKQAKVSVSNVPSYGENTVAEHTFALILALSRKIVDSADRTRKGDFTLDGLRGFDLKGKTIGIIGTGHIGQHAIRMAKGFEMKVIAFDIKKNSAAAKKLGFSYASLDTLLQKSDIISLHCPYNKSTHHLINNRNIGKMRKGAMLINTARGGIVETRALLRALNDGTIAAAGLDVLEEECNIKEEKQLLVEDFQKECDLRTMLANHMLLKHKNVIITPHNAFNSKEALLRILNATIENIEAFAKRKPINVVR